MRFMNTDDLLLGRTAPVQPNQSFKKELILKGIPPQLIEKLFTTGIFDNGDESIELYVGAQGYTFGWGHIFEDFFTVEEDGEIFNFASWCFCFDGLLEEFHQKGLFLEDLSGVCMNLLSNQYGRPCFNRQIPDYVGITVGNEASAFGLIVGGIGETGLDEIHNAREWIACCFLDPILERLLGAVKKSLRLRFP